METNDRNSILNELQTEKTNARTANIDKESSLGIVTLMNNEDAFVAEAVKEALPEIACAVDAAFMAIKLGGRMIYLGAGTSGRLGILDASECPPTFGVSPEIVQGLIAGGDTAIRTAVENAEDSEELAKEALAEINLSPKDFVVGISASGRTPFVKGAIMYAKSLGCKTASISCNKNSAIGEIADIVIEAITGPEVITGSTRLKAGTAQKMILNMISTGAMIKLGKVKGNLMTNMIPTNEKLRLRTEKIRRMLDND